jgi:hypothetical protein
MRTGPHSDQTKQRISEALRKADAEGRRQFDERARSKMSAGATAKWKEPGFRERMAIQRSAAGKRRWQNPQYRQKMLVATRGAVKRSWDSGTRKLPTSWKNNSIGLRKAYAEGRIKPHIEALCNADSPYRRKGLSNPGSKVWRLRSPNNVVYEFKNINHFVSTHPDLFTDADRVIKYGSYQAQHGLATLSPHRKNPRGSWKGWTWCSVVERTQNEAQDLLNRIAVGEIAQ